MADYGRFGGSGHADRERERSPDRDFDRDRDFDQDTDREGKPRSGRFFGWGRGDDDNRGGRQRAFEGRSDSPAERRSRYGRDWDRDERYYGYDDYHEGLPINETGRLIASNKVEGTPVYGRGGDRLGTIYNFMVDKYSGQVEYAVMRYGGFLGLGQRYYPLPWRILSYDTRQGGYRIEMSHRDMERAPSFGRDDEPSFSRDYGRRVNDWYGVR
ncbi:MAG TPA: PRC-barrel domain-containing protein [Allosphingosinicella sp.]|jgi:sporulation protein YlmC with PRC-barrel domain